MIDEHILHYQHKLDRERKQKFLANDPMSRLGSRMMQDTYDIHKKLCDLGIEHESLNIYDDPLDVFKKLVIKENMAVLLKEYVPDDYVLVHKPSGKQKPVVDKKKTFAVNPKCVIM